MTEDQIKKLYVEYRIIKRLIQEYAKSRQMLVLNNSNLSFYDKQIREMNRMVQQLKVKINNVKS